MQPSAREQGAVAGVVYPVLYATGGTQGERHVMTKEELSRVLTTFDLRERLILKLTGIAGMRPGEAYALQWADQTNDGLRITRRVYRSIIDSPKSSLSVRLVSLGRSTDDLQAWRSLQRDTAPNAWIFPCENGKTPLSPSNHWRRHLRPTVKNLGLEPGCHFKACVEGAAVSSTTWAPTGNSSASNWGPLSTSTKTCTPASASTGNKQR